MTLQFDPYLVRDQFSLTQFRRLIAKDVWSSSNWVSGWGGGGSGIHYSLNIKPIIYLIKILGYSLK